MVAPGDTYLAHGQPRNGGMFGVPIGKTVRTLD